MRIAGIILAGGQSRRMAPPDGGAVEKALLPLAGVPLIQHVIGRLGCAQAINANGDPTRFGAFDLPVIRDTIPDWPGPLAGILAGMEWAAAHGHSRIVTAAADTPFFPPTLAADLAGIDAPVVMARHQGRAHPVFAAWDVQLREALRQDILAGERRPRAWAERNGVAWCNVESTGDPFFNINTPDDLRIAAQMMDGLSPD
ncbi:MAG: molybdenum cofactor guanylyltransferase [Paracoccus denitrificans]|nr:MAG: molybdenum cofactor guanylyltransferase [Paracoccus denitrificans]PZO85453.1 MAG: molybdenum cofactor guanylyltransferase [Paracoccus denitrificans]